MNSQTHTLIQLESARSLALGDGRYYPTIIPGVLPLIAAKPDAALEICRWGAEFLAETFAAPTWSADDKTQCSLAVLPTLAEYIGSGDTATVKGAVQAAASIYPLIFRHV